MALRTMMRFLITLAVAIGWSSGHPTAIAQTSWPMLMSLSPVAAQVGTTSEHTLESRYSLFGACDVLVTGDGVSAEVVTPMELDKDGKEPSLTKIGLRWTVDKDALPGVREFRVVGPTGASTLGQIVIVRDPVIVESQDNNTAETAQPISVPAAVCGTVEKAEDVDIFRFSLDETRKLTFHCRAMRLEDAIHDLQTHIDPILTLRHAGTGSTIAAADNAFAADPFLACELAAGEYLLELRDVRYQGNRYWNWVVEISDRPFVRQVHPLTLAADQPTELQLIGAHLPPDATATATAAAASRPADTTTRLRWGDVELNPVPLGATSLPVHAEPTDANDEFAAGLEVPVPAVMNGCIEQPGDQDVWVFEAKKGQPVFVEVAARRLGSELDSIIRILNDEGRTLAENDDHRLWNRRTVQDSRIDNWTPPADGRYAVEIRDLHLRGGESFVYSLTIDAARPEFELTLDTDKTWLTPGTCGVIFVRAVRRNGFDRPIELHIEGLPEGVTAHCGRILGGSAVDGCIVLEADAEAAMRAANVRVFGTAVPAEGGAESEARVAARPMQEIYMPGGGRNHWPVTMHTVAIGRPADLLDVRLSEYDLTLRPGGTATIDVEIVRADGFDKNVTLDLLYQHLSSRFAEPLPPGVTIDAKNSVTLLTGRQTRGAITLKAAPDAAPVTRHQCAVMANISINFVMKSTWSSRPLLISVSED